MGLATGEQNLVLNVDDGRIAGRDHIWVQGSLTLTVTMLTIVDLYINM